MKRRGEALALCFVLVVGLTLALRFCGSRKERRESVGTAWSSTVPVKSAPVLTITKEDP
jgi:hypothetical protein